MGNKYEVKGWTYRGTPTAPVNGTDWYWEELYSGGSLLKAIWVTITSRAYYGCVKLECR